MGTHARIDVHQHILPPAWVEWLKSRGIHDGGGIPFPAWSVAGALAMMDDREIATGILSLSTPGVHLDPTKTVDAVARAKAREVNECAAQVARDHRGRFGFFASLTLPDVDGAIEAASYALDTLGASGVILQANTHGRYLGDPADEPLFA